MSDGTQSTPDPGTVPTPDARQRAIDALCEAFARDEMELAELEERLEMVHRAETSEQLGLIQADLPTAPVPAGQKPATSATPIRPSPAPSDLAPRPTLPPDRIPDNSVIVGILGGGARRGSWIPARNNWALGLMGGCEIDLRDAQLSAGVTEIRVLAIMGGVDIIAPPDVQVESSGIGIMGGFDVSNHYRPPTHADAPVIRVTGLALMGGCSVNVRFPGETARDARNRIKAEKKAQKLLAKGRD